MMHFHKILVKMVVINEISAQNNPNTIKFSTQNAIEGHKIDFGIHFCTPHIQVDFRPYYISLIPYILFPSSAVRYKIHTSIPNPIYIVSAQSVRY